MPLNWTVEHDDLSYTRWPIKDGHSLELQVESLWVDVGWDWHVWDSTGQVSPRHGFADTLKKAKANAEAALDMMLWDLKLIRLIPSQPATALFCNRRASG